MDLFDHSLDQRMRHEAPLAARMRPRALQEFIGQDDILGHNRLLRRAIESDKLFSSILLWGPPGSGKTTLAHIIANQTRSHFDVISAVLAGLPQLRAMIIEAQERRKLHGIRTILFVDEVHRWNKAQQDALLPHIENGIIVMIGATTENPYFEVSGPLLSRSRVFRLNALTNDDMQAILNRALDDKEYGYGERDILIEKEALVHLVTVAGGDARNALNALELAVESVESDPKGTIHVTLQVAQDSIQRRALLYDQDGDAHYDTISAFIKSVRGSDPDAALYWLARMLYAGESPRFILRRLLVLSGEDVGLADPMAIVVANSACQAFERIGMPEGVYPIVEATLYLATAHKSNSARGYFTARAAVEKEGNIEVPPHLKDASRDASTLAHGVGYTYPHNHPGHYVRQQYLPNALLGTRFYEPTNQGYEAQLLERLEHWRSAQSRASQDI